MFKKELIITVTTNRQVIFECEQGIFVFDTIEIIDKTKEQTIGKSICSQEGFVQALEIVSNHYKEIDEEMTKEMIQE